MPLVPLARHWRRDAETLVIGLINNMPDAALKTTEWQVRDLLARASGARPVSLRVFSLPEVPRSEAGLAHVRQHHDDIAELWRDGVDALIVTGTEPKAAVFEDEPYWRALTNLIDWAEDNTASAIWSCLASHAAAYHIDRIKRQPIGRKMFGVFDCDKAIDHPLVSGPPRWKTPHSRFNAVEAEALQEAGYQILSRSREAGVDMFVKQRNSLFVFLQGHPEYDATALFGEYRRDVRRFLNGENDCYPELAHDYFTGEATAELLSFRERAVAHRDPVLFEQFPAASVGAQLTALWRDAATRIYANWLSHLADCRARRLGCIGWTGTRNNRRRLAPSYA
jgi:homoserine O-succinyltransferase/O-acetyltransferase